MRQDEFRKEYERLLGLFKNSGADENRLALCDSLVVECARAKVQLDELNEIADKTGLVKVNPSALDMQRPLPVATELTKVRASLTNMLTKLDKMLCTSIEEEYDDLDEFE